MKINKGIPITRESPCLFLNMYVFMISILTIRNKIECSFYIKCIVFAMYLDFFIVKVCNLNFIL